MRVGGVAQLAPALFEPTIANELRDGDALGVEDLVQLTCRDEVGVRDHIGAQRGVTQVLHDVVADAHEGMSAGVGRRNLLVGQLLSQSR